MVLGMITPFIADMILVFIGWYFAFQPIKRGFLVKITPRLIDLFESSVVKKNQQPGVIFAGELRRIN